MLILLICLFVCLFAGRLVILRGIFELPKTNNRMLTTMSTLGTNRHRFLVPAVRTAFRLVLI